MKKFSNFSGNVISRNKMKNVKGGVLRDCTCTSGNNKGAKFEYATSGSTVQAQSEYRDAVCNGGFSSCEDTLAML
jgi:natural product precursor